MFCKVYYFRRLYTPGTHAPLLIAVIPYALLTHFHLNQIFTNF